MGTKKNKIVDVMTIDEHGREKILRTYNSAELKASDAPIQDAEEAAKSFCTGNKEHLTYVVRGKGSDEPEDEEEETDEEEEDEDSDEAEEDEEEEETDEVESYDELSQKELRAEGTARGLTLPKPGSKADTKKNLIKLLEDSDTASEAEEDEA